MHQMIARVTSLPLDLDAHNARNRRDSMELPLAAGTDNEVHPEIAVLTSKRLV